MSSDVPVLEELARRGDLVLVRSRATGELGLLRDDTGEPVWFDGGEWAWINICVAPLARLTLAHRADPPLR
jgi:hypothetical protein